MLHHVACVCEFVCFQSDILLDSSGLTWHCAGADDRAPDADNEAEATRLSIRITSAKQQADALEERLRRLHRTSSARESAEGGNEASPDTEQQAARRATLAVEYCKARIARLQAAKDAVDASAAAAEQASIAQKAEL